MKLKIVLMLFVTIRASVAADLLQDHCNKKQGIVVDTFTCPRTKLKLNWNFCLAKTAKDEPIFFDGCTGPSGGHAALFYPACIQHDLCYHHEPLTSGLSQKDCDQQFLKQALASCSQSPNQKSCQKWAHTMFYALRTGGVVAFNCSKSKADYK